MTIIANNNQINIVKNKNHASFSNLASQRIASLSNACRLFIPPGKWCAETLLLIVWIIPQASHNSESVRFHLFVRWLDVPCLQRKRLNLDHSLLGRKILGLSSQLQGLREFHSFYPSFLDGMIRMCWNYPANQDFVILSHRWQIFYTTIYRYGRCFAVFLPLSLLRKSSHLTCGGGLLAKTVGLIFSYDILCSASKTSTTRGGCR